MSPSELEYLSPTEIFRLISCIVTGMIHLFAAVCSFYLDRRDDRFPAFALVFALIGYCTITLGSATAGVERFFPPILVLTPLFSGYIGAALFIYTRQLTAPHRPLNLKWLLLGLLGTSHSLIAMIIPNGLDPSLQAIVYQKPYWHPILSPIILIHGAQLIGFIVVSTYLISKAFWMKSRPDLRRSQFWLLVICWTCSSAIIFTNILPMFNIIIIPMEPALFMLPIAIIGIMSIRSLGAESELIYRNKIQERSTRMDSLGRMARGIAHDMNNILASVMGHAEVALLKTNPTAKSVSHLNQIILGTQRAALLIDRMLTYSGKREPPTSIIDPHSRILSVFDSLSSIQPSHHRMVLDLAATLPRIKIDETKLDSAILNLLHNALQALNDSSGQVRLRAVSENSPQLPPDSIGEDLTDQLTLRIEVEDNGSGMSEEASSRALEPFFSTQPQGKGLGLLNVLSTVKDVGGALWFHTEKDVGTRFVMWFPACLTGSSQGPVLFTSVPSMKNILLVEDDSALAQILLEMLPTGPEIRHYTSAEQTLDALTQSPQLHFEIAILDIRLEKIDGITLGHQLLQEQRIHSLLFISGDEPGDRLQQFKGQPVLFRRKPLGLTDLEEALIELSHFHRDISPSGLMN